MKTNRSSLSFKITLIGIGVFGLLFFFWALPSIGKTIAEAYPEFAHAYLPWLSLFWILAIPCYLVLFLFWQVAKSIDVDELFAISNSKRFIQVANLAIINCIILGVGNILFLVLNINHPSIVIGSMCIILLGIAFNSCMRFMAEIFQRGEVLQDESDLTI